MSNIKRVFYYLVSLISLGIMAAGIRGLLYLVLDIPLGQPSLVGRADFTRQQLSLAVAMLVIGSPLWLIFWHSIQRHLSQNAAEAGASMRKLYLNLILLVTALVSLYNCREVLIWLFSPNRESLIVVGSLATLVVTAGIWYFHWRISEREGHPSSAALTWRRWQVYSLSAWGLIWLTVGIVQTVAGLALTLPLGSKVLAGGHFWSESVRGSVASIILGGAYWGFHWFYMARNDIGTTLRQVYIYLLAIIASSIAGLAALIVSLYQILVWITGSAEGLAGTHFQFLDWTIPTITVAAGVWSYHNFLSKEESSHTLEIKNAAKRVHLYIMSFLGLGIGVAGIIQLLGVIIMLLVNAVSPEPSVQSGWWQRQLSLCLAFIIPGFPLWWFYWKPILNLVAAGGTEERRARSRRVYLYLIVGVTIVTLAAALVNIIYQLLVGGMNGNLGLSVLRNIDWSVQLGFVAVPLLVYHWRITREDQRSGAESPGAGKTVSLLAGDNLPDLVRQLESRLGIRIKGLRSSINQPASGLFSEDDLTTISSQVAASASPQILVVVQADKTMVIPYTELRR